MSKPDTEAEVKVVLALNAKSASKNEIFSKVYSISEVDKISEDIRNFLLEYRENISSIIKMMDEHRAKNSVTLQSQTLIKDNKLPDKQLNQELEENTVAAPSPRFQPNSELKFVSACGCYDVEASAYLLTIDGHPLMIDAGYSEKNQIDLSLVRAQKPEAIIVTHAHLDHVGALPQIHRIYPQIPIYMTPVTQKLAYKILEDSINVASSKGNDIPFTKNEINQTLQSVTCIDFDEEFNLGNLKIVFRCAGHILGAAYVLVKGNKSVLYTGDISTKKLLTTPSAYLPTAKENIDLLISESTYGSSGNLEPRETEVVKFCSKVNAVLERGGRVLIPSFALGRAQEVFTILLSEMKKGSLKKVPVVLDGLARDIAEYYDYFSEYMPSGLYKECRESDNLSLVSGRKERQQIALDKSPRVIIASSGMLTGGPSVAYAREILPEAKSAILTVGYIDQETPGRRLADSSPGEAFELVSDEGVTEIVRRKCEIQEYKLSSHSNQTELINFILTYNPAAVFLVHGEKKNKVSLANTLRQSRIYPVIIPRNEQEIDVDRLLTFWGKIKTAAKAPRKTGEELNWALNNITEKIYQQSSGLALENSIQAIQEAGLLNYCGSPMDFKPLFFGLFEWSLKYARRNEGLEFEFPARVLQNGTELMDVLFGKGFGQRFLFELGSTLPRMFKNFILGGGRKYTSRHFAVVIESERQLKSSLDNLRRSFASFEMLIPTLADVQKACEDQVRLFPQAEEAYSKFFGELPAEKRPLNKQESPKTEIAEEAKNQKIVSPITNQDNNHIKQISTTNITAEAISEASTEETNYGEKCLECNSDVEKQYSDGHDGLCSSCYYKRLQFEAYKAERRSGTLGADRAGGW